MAFVSFYGVRRLWLLAFGFSAGCFSITEFPASGSTGTVVEGSSSTSGLLPTGADPSVGDTSSSSGFQADGSTGPDAPTGFDDTGCGFLSCPTRPPPAECDVWNDDCAEGEKCTYWGVGNTYDGTRCVPIDANAVSQGEPCTDEGQGFDNCEAGTMCISTFSYPEPTCVPVCTGSPRAPECDDPHLICYAWGGPLSICLPACTPLNDTDCYAGDACYLTDNSLDCAMDESGDAGQAFDPCESYNACDPGLACVPAETVGLCESGESCCTPFCVLSDPTCPEGTECVPMFGDEHPNEWQDVGVCGQPAD